MAKDFSQYVLHPPVRQPVDHRDFPVRVTAPTAPELPSKAMVPRQFPVRDQGSIGSCTGFANTAMAQRYFARTRGDTTPLSALALYYAGRCFDRSTDRDAGAWPRSSIKAAQKFGIVPEDQWPYHAYSYKFTEEPPFPARFAALFRKVDQYVFPKTIDELKESIALGYGFTCAVFITQAFYDAAYNGGTVADFDPNAQILGAHLIYVDSYDDATQRFGFENSWSTSYGNQGYGTLPYQYVYSNALWDAVSLREAA